MSEELYTVEVAARRLKVHAKTVLRYIRDGRLRAARVGKSYRILRSDLEALAGVDAASRPAASARVTSIVDIPDAGPDLARRLAAHLPADRTGNGARGDPMSLDIAHDPARDHVKVVIVGSPADTAAMLGLIQFFLQA